ncbi:MAG: family 78 glycoside hydrolase catalytic domain [Bacteroides sp.]|nr:family 78 glycoside hydrolase catalytic domain [Bacteroides sp.]
MKKILYLFFLTAVFAACQDSSVLKVEDLKCEMLEAPLAIDNTSPHFSWKMRSKQNGATATAYQILVATTLDKLNEEEADLWNTGKVADAASVGIAYGGKPLASRSLAYWKVRVWNQKDEASDWSKPTSFGIGLLSDRDWAGNASFIGVEQADEKSQSALLLRKQFTYHPVEGTVLLYVNSLGYHEAYVNGRAVSDAVLAPAVSQWGKRSQIVAYDVTSLLKKGENELVLWTGIGWYQTHNKAVVPGGPYVRAQMDVITTQGVETLVATDATWQSAESGRRTFGAWLPHQMGGETVDARTTPADLMPKTLAALAWKPVVVADIPAHQATPQMCELNKKIRSFHPVSVKQDEDGWYIYDMGTNFVGFTEVKMPVVAEGAQVELHYDDYFLTDSVGFREGLYTDYYIGNGKAGSSFSSKFNYKGYRYLKLIGLKEALPLSDITASLVHTDYSGEATFACSDEDMNAIYQMTHNTLEALSLGGYIVDCPQIERLGYGGDGNASLVTAQTFFNLAPLYMNWMQAWSDCQREDGGMPHTAPNPYTAGGGPYWCGFIIPASWQTYVNYGDMRLMERYYPVMQKWLGYAESYQVDGLLKQWPNTEYRGWYLGDWVPPMGINPRDPASIDIVNNCFLSDCYHMMVKIAKVLGKEADIPGYQQKHEALNALIHETFFDKEKSSYASGSQIDLIYPMLVGATPESSVKSVEETLFQESAGRFKGHIATGLVGISILTQWATQNQEADFVYGMLKKRTYPGYLYMIDNGATLTWEEWDGERSQLHNCYNAIGSWFIQALAGITPDEDTPGYRRFHVRPQMVDGITWVKASKDTPYGMLSVKWESKGDAFTLSVEVPVGTTAMVCLPNGEEVELTSGKHDLNGRV